MFRKDLLYNYQKWISSKNVHIFNADKDCLMIRRNKSMAEIKITAQNFDDEVLNSTIPVLVDFWASWCGPCRMLAPSVAQLAESYEGKVKVGKVNVDEEPQLAARFGIMSIPTLIVFENGEIKNQSIGLCSYEELESMIK